LGTLKRQRHGGNLAQASAIEYFLCMKIAEAGGTGGYLIRSYAPGRVLIGGTAYEEGLIVSPDRIITGWGPQRPADLEPVHVAALTELEPQVIVIGTGVRQLLPEPRVWVPALSLGIGVEIMDTGAACRTYNILLAEGRKVAAGLIMC
jgi:uncharacterized protein